MSLEVRGVDHELIGLAALGGELGKDPVEHAQAAPADEAVVDRLMRTIGGRRITPAQPVPDHEDDTADDPPIIDPRNAMRKWEIGLNPAHLRLAQHPDLRQQQRLLSVAIDSTDCLQRKRFNGF